MSKINGEYNGQSKEIPFLPDGQKYPKKILVLPNAREVANRISRRATHNFLLRVPIELLDNALKVRIGKAPDRSRRLREKAKLYNEARMDERKIWVEKLEHLLYGDRYEND